MQLTEFSLERLDHSGMQATHERELDLIARVADQIDGAVAGEQVQFALDGLLAELLEHTGAHFVAEERLMARYPFPPAAAHAAEHERAIGLLRQIIDGWRCDRDMDALRDGLLNRHLAWMRRHLSTMDYLTAQFIEMAEHSGL